MMFYFGQKIIWRKKIFILLLFTRLKMEMGVFPAHSQIYCFYNKDMPLFRMCHWKRLLKVTNRNIISRCDKLKKIIKLIAKILIPGFYFSWIACLNKQNKR